MSEQSPGQVAAPKKTKIMLTQLERVVFERCRETGDNAQTALLLDGELCHRITNFVTGEVRQDRINARLENDIDWMKQQIKKLKAGVPESEGDDQRRAALNDENSMTSADEALRRMQSGAEEMHGAVDA